MAEQLDSEILEIYRNGNKSYAFNLLMKKYQVRLYWHIRRLLIGHEDTDDVLQNTFIKAWKGLENFREEAQVFTWLYRIATNECISFLRRKKMRTFIPFVHIEKTLKETLESESEFDGNEIEKKLHEAILTLPEKQRVIFNMRYFDELKYEEMSEILDVTVGALKASYHHAAKKIEKFFVEKD
jgi:RNA polymerase sigma-70 factor, ECF subfamily